MKNNIVLVYDIKSIPIVGESTLDFESLVDIYEDRKIVLWDSTNEGVEPKLIQVGEDTIPEIKLVNTKNLTNEEIKLLISRKDEQKF